MEEKIKNISEEYSNKIKQAKSLKELDESFLALFGKKGEITLLPKEFSKLSKVELQRVGPLFNQIKAELEKEIGDRRYEIHEESYKNLVNENIDLTSVKLKTREGHLHPLTIFEKKIADLFGKLGFQQYDGPEIETDLNNFELLNIPPDHPSRDMWDTLYIRNKEPASPAKRGEQGTRNKLLLRTHATASQPRILKECKPPIRMMVIGRCFRYENLDPRHEHTFDQFDLIYVDRGLNMANLQFLSEYFLKAMLGEDIKVRLSPGYYPFTEPSAHIFGTCVFCKGSGCKICGETGELELAGAGMIHPKVLKNCGIDPEVYSGIAWGVGPGRMAMLKYGINDLRLFNSGDLKFLQGLKNESK
ncbi:phenylalanine--tRNA ligase subunit alpha [Candidatus Daviesbacteria bacterium RIFCSPHIGHO2_12_FULL_37_11]|uniref:Phenylalanine--tRNA ligase alpha subunit n=1 Tax=Candidatus Daviesbacteria bacterium RIFCSPHIGHO2_12_FULL_37_11 TaxID=1797777 RepID=A0A1F5KE59_9BACT|nr:MAG: phenylalanine--tRNA ligase subunit alpha [Candidatus Daviesbacteria bacterium GWA1_38_6]OGE39080.1 MAG: phenylalanine--tRNA ligase subunit alpha [Candidatus Daviesbacteria bacterium RIFCSPHIGHO2_12_FULL_37_11]OGE44795.1 MAG: phenylalanine--tRNA ligase subunit alpha [Candidatus Daviesbacteria bacterium RIFCSPLOWO2_01_FULL_37_10]